MRILAFLGLLLLATELTANEWRQFRGTDGQGVVTDAKNLPITWSESENVIWKADIPGRGWSSPVFVDSTIWLSAAVEQAMEGEALEKARATKLDKNPVAKQMALFDKVTLRAIGIDAASGKVVHDIELFKITDAEPIHLQNSFASPSPVLDGKMLYCHFGEMGTACVDTETAKVIWKAQLPSKHAVGPGSSPIVYNGLVIVPCDGTDQQYVIALDKKRVIRFGRPIARH
jgi:hypothetical protein